jgi:hypothetical protein
VQKITKELLFSFWSFVGFALIEVYEAQCTNYPAPHVNHTPSFAKLMLKGQMNQTPNKPTPCEKQSTKEQGTLTYHIH